MARQLKLDQYFQHVPTKTNLVNTQERQVRKCDDYYNMTLEQFSDCTNIKELITADMREKMPHKFQRKFLLVDKYVKRVYDRYISDPRYREKPLFANLVFDPKPWYTKRDRELLKQYGISKCFVKMYENNILKDIADTCLQNAIKAHGEEMSEAITRSLPLYIKKILDLYLVKYKTLDRFLRKYKKHSSRHVKGSSKKISNSATSVVSVLDSQDVSMNTQISFNHNGESTHSLNSSTSAQQHELIDEPNFHSENNTNRCGTQKTGDLETVTTPISHDCAYIQKETLPEVESSEFWNRNINTERCNILLNNGNSLEHYVEEHFESSKENWLEREYGIDPSKHIVKPLKKELREAIAMRIKQLYPNVIENIDEVVNKTFIRVWKSITGNVEERQDILGFIGMQSESRCDSALKSKIESNTNMQNPSEEEYEVAEELKENGNLPLPKMLTYLEFKNFTNIKEYLHKDITRKYPYKSENYLMKMEKYIRKFYKNYIMGSDIWPNGISFKSKEYLNEFHKKYKPQKVKCEPRTDNININESEVVLPNPIICGKSVCSNNATSSLNGKRKHLSKTTDLESAVNISDTNKKQDDNRVAADSVSDLINLEKELNAQDIHNAPIGINSSYVNNATKTRVDFQSTKENPLTNRVSALGAKHTESDLNKPMVIVPRYAHAQWTNNEMCGTKDKVYENATSSFPASLDYVGSNNTENQFKGQTSEFNFSINNKGIKKELYLDDEISRENQIKETRSNLPEGESDVAFIPHKEPEYIYISDEPLTSSLLLEEMMRSPTKTPIGPYELPAGFSTCCEANKDKRNMEAIMTSKGSSQNISESSQRGFDILENKLDNSYELESNAKENSNNIHSDENNRKAYEKEPPEIMNLCPESEKNSTGGTVSNPKISNRNAGSNGQGEVITPALKITKSKGECKTTGVSNKMNEKLHVKEVNVKIKKQLKNKNRELKKIKHTTSKIPAPDLNNCLVAQKVHTFRPLLLIKKSKETQQNIVPTLSVQEPACVNLLDPKYLIEDASLVCSVSSEKNDTSNKSATIDLLNKDNSYFTSSQLVSKVPEPPENPSTPSLLEHPDKINGTPAERTEITSSATVINPKLGARIDMLSNQKYPTVIENKDLITNNNVVKDCERIIRSTEERSNISGSIGIQIEPRDSEELSEIELNGDNTQNHSTEVRKILEDCTSQKVNNLLLPKMLSYNEFSEYSNIKEYLQNDIIKKYPYKSTSYLKKMDKYIRKFYKNYIMGSDTWPTGVFFKSKEFLHEFLQKHKPVEMKCIRNVYAVDKNARENDINKAINPIICLNSNATSDLKEREKHFSRQADAESAADFDINIIQSTTEESLAIQLKAEDTNETESGSNVAMVSLSHNADLCSTNINIDSSKREVSETAVTSFSSLFNPADEENRLEDQSLVCSFPIRVEDIKREIVTDDEGEVDPENQSTENYPYLSEAAGVKEEEGADMQNNQQFLNEIENNDDVVNDTLISAYQRMAENEGERNYMLGSIEAPSIPRGIVELKTEMEPIANNSQNYSAEVHKSLEATTYSENIPPPKMLSYHEFKECSNIKDYLQNDIIKKFPCKSANYLIKMDKYIRKFYKNYIIGTDRWPNGVFFKRDVLHEFREKHKTMELKYEADVDADNHGANIRMNTEYMSENSIFCIESLDVNNGKVGHVQKSEDTNFKREDNIEIVRSISGHESTILNNTENELNVERIHNTAPTQLDSNGVYSGIMRKEDNQSWNENLASGRRLNPPMVIIPRFEHLYAKNISIGTTREVDECGATSSHFGISNSVGSGDRENRIREEEFTMRNSVESDASQIKEEESSLHERENDVKFTYKEPELNIFDVSLNSVSLMGNMMLSEHQNITNPNRLSPQFSDCSSNALNFVENDLHDPDERDKEKSYNRNLTKNNAKRSLEKQTESEKNKVNSLKRRNENLIKFKKLTSATQLNNSEISQNSYNINQLPRMSKVRVKLKRISTRNLKPGRKGKKIKRLRKDTIRTPAIHLSNDEVSQSRRKADPLLLMSKVKVRVHRMTKQNFTTKYPNIKWPGSAMD